MAIRTRKATIPALCLLLALLSACTSGPARKSEGDVTAMAGRDGIQRASVTAGSYFFEPARITVRVGVPVELTVKKEAGLTPHDFTISAPEAGIEVSVSLSADPAVVSFTPARAGLYPYYCSKKLPLMTSHRDRGMVGVLEVAE